MVRLGLKVLIALALFAAYALAFSFESEYYSISSPEDHINDAVNTKISTIAAELDRAMPVIESITCLPSPYGKWNVSFVYRSETTLGKNFSGSYIQGTITIVLDDIDYYYSTDRVLQTLLHETVHGFNEYFYFVGPKNGTQYKETIPWWNEGTAESVSYRALEELGHALGALRNEKRGVISGWGGGFSFINTWDPFDSKYTDIGYAYSFSIVDKLSQYDSKLVCDFNKLTNGKGILPNAESYQLRNNQMLFLLSRSANRDLTNDFKGFGFDVSPWKDAEGAIESANRTISALENMSRPVFYNSSRDLLDAAYDDLFVGDFGSAAEGASAALSQAALTEKSVNDTLSILDAANGSITALRSGADGAFYAFPESILAEAYSSFKAGGLDAAQEKAAQAMRLASNITGAKGILDGISENISVFERNGGQFYEAPNSLLSSAYRYLRSGNANTATSIGRLALADAVRITEAKGILDGISKNISAFEQADGPFYQTSNSLLLDAYGNLKAGNATAAVALGSQAFEDAARISLDANQLRTELSETKTMLDSQNAFTSLFLAGASDAYKAAANAYDGGDLEGARNLLARAGAEYANANAVSTVAALLIVLSIAGPSGYFVYSRRRKRGVFDVKIK